ncbi:MAG: hypothetical protein IJ570_04340 [Prevotella sp.]|nr:hypothetical protein [Prevotella sp.]
MKRSLFFLISLLLLFAVGCADRKEPMLAQLAELERQNVADSLMTNDSLAKALVAYFDDHGTPNERLRAHYILGRTYADLGEAPAALDAYLDAAACADTIAADCDWGKLSRVYSQMADVYYGQYLLEDYIVACNQSIKSAWKAADTIQVLRESLLQLAGFDQMGQFDSVIIKSKALFANYANRYAPFIAQYSIIPVRSFLEYRQLEDAGQFLSIYESNSGFIDANGQVCSGMETYYFYRGLYYTYREQYDSAEYFFRRELKEGLDAENQNMASYGLANLYKRIGKADSAVYYALYSYAMNDSAYDVATMEEVEKTKALYNYSRHQQIAIQEHERAVKGQKIKVRLYLTLTLLSLVFVLAISFWRRKKKENAKKYQQKIDELFQANKELRHLQTQKESLESQIIDREEIIQQQTIEIDLLKQHETQFKELIDGKEAVIDQKGKELETIKHHREMLLLQIAESKELIEQMQADVERVHQDDLLTERLAENQLTKSPVYQQLERLSYAPRKLSEEEWKAVENMVKDTFPQCYAFLLSHKTTFAIYEYQICLLLRLHFRMKQTAAFIGIAKSQVSIISTGILAQVFHESGSGKELKKRLESIF